MSGLGGQAHPVVSAPRESRFLSQPDGVLLVEPGEGSPGVTFPVGFLAAGISAGLKESGRPDMGVLAVAPDWRPQAASAAVFTTNAFAAAPVIVSRTECDLAHLSAVIMNSGNANACTGPLGTATAQAMQTVCADALGEPSSRVAVCSTGIIGVQLDPSAVAAGAEKAAAAIGPKGGADFAQSILTTDRFPKICAYEVETSAGPVRLGACAKGAGMIAPAMATMLCVVTTDALLGPTEMRDILHEAVGASFNRITVDGEMSTNDSVLFLSSGATGILLRGNDLARFAKALEAILLRLALMMVADGEGATKIIRAGILGAETPADAISVARAVGDSPLVKTAMHGCDPNWGRVISSAGAAMAGRSLPRASLQLCGITVVESAAACPVSDTDRAALSAAMKQPEIDISLNLGLGPHSAEVFFADMGHEYITINAEYHS